MSHNYSDIQLKYLYYSDMKFMSTYKIAYYADMQVIFQIDMREK